MKWDKPQKNEGYNFFEVEGRLLPFRRDVPKEFTENWYEPDCKWCKIAEYWFFNGLNPKTKFIPKEGINLSDAIFHLRVCLNSRQPCHEDKIAGVGYLMSLWFEDIQDFE